MKAEKNEVEYTLIAVQYSKDVAIFKGTKSECKAKRKELKHKYNEMHLTIDRLITK